MALTTTNRRRILTIFVCGVTSFFALTNSAHALFGMGCDKPKSTYSKLIIKGQAWIEIERAWCRGKNSNTPGVDFSRLLGCASMNPSEKGKIRYDYPTQDYDLAYQVVLNNSKCFNPELVARIQIYLKSHLGHQPWF